jgi:hypothetical protein
MTPSCLIGIIRDEFYADHTRCNGVFGRKLALSGFAYRIASSGVTNDSGLESMISALFTLHNAHIPQGPSR